MMEQQGRRGGQEGMMGAAVNAGMGENAGGEEYYEQPKRARRYWAFHNDLMIMHIVVRWMRHPSPKKAALLGILDYIYL